MEVSGAAGDGLPPAIDAAGEDVLAMAGREAVETLPTVPLVEPSTLGMGAGISVAVSGARAGGTAGVVDSITLPLVLLFMMNGTLAGSAAALRPRRV